MRTGLKNKKIVKKTKKEDYFLNLRNGCPRLKDNLCIIHNNSKRPVVCKQFPIFIQNKKIKLSSWCLAVKMNLFYPYVHEFLKIGYKLS